MEWLHAGRPRDVVPVGYGALLKALARCARPDHDARERLRERLRDTLGVPHVFLLSSAREGLGWLLSRVAARRPGGEVVLPNYNFFAVAQAVVLAGLKPVFIDAALPGEEPSFSAAERAIGPQTAAILLSHHFGRPSDGPRWRALADAHGLDLVEDCAHAFGARIAGRTVGAFGEGGVFSLSLTKGLVGVAGGVVVTTGDHVARDLAAREAALPEPSASRAGVAIGAAIAGKALLDPALYPALAHAPNVLAQRLGVDPIDSLMTEQPAPPDFDARPSALHPAFAGVALAHLETAAREAEQRRDVARRIVCAREWRHLRLPAFESDRSATHLVVCVRTPFARELRRDLLKAGFDARPDYLEAMVLDRRRLPVSSRLPEEGLYLPHRALGDARAIDRLVDVLARFDAAHADTIAPPREEPTKLPVIDLAG